MRAQGGPRRGRSRSCTAHDETASNTRPRYAWSGNAGTHDAGPRDTRSDDSWTGHVCDTARDGWAGHDSFCDTAFISSSKRAPSSDEFSAHSAIRNPSDDRPGTEDACGDAID